MELAPLIVPPSRVSRRAKAKVLSLTPFHTIRARAEKRKGGAAALARLMPRKPAPKALRKCDDRVLA